MVPFRSSSRRSRRSVESSNDRTSSDRRSSSERDQYIMTFPMHPLPSMQAPFEESMLDATHETGYVPFQNPNKNVDKRQQLLCRDGEASEMAWNFTYNCHWRNHPKGKYHPLRKTMAQIVFGVHLLHQHLEKSVADVADILLKHVNELDGFLQRANEDIEGSLKDMLFRRKCLKVPMEHVSEFDRLLDDRMYRAQLLDGNVTIERTINRMSSLLNDYLIDMSTFRDANHELDAYLGHIGHTWTDENDDVRRIYSAMCGNTSGWSQFLQSLVAKAEKLGVVLVQVSSYCNEIEKRCGAASRRSLIASRSSSRSTNSRDAARSFRNFADNKPLPMVPNERPPFITVPSTTNDQYLEESVYQRHPSNQPIASTAGGIASATDPDSREFLRQESDHAESTTTTSTQASSSDDTVLPRKEYVQSEHYQTVTSSGHDRYDSEPRENPNRPTPDLRLPHSDMDDTSGPKRAALQGGKGDYSPPLTGKDSAYSSASGGSFISPTAAHPRSASAQSSHTPRAHFGLFPSSNPSTPKQSISGRHGAISPASSSPQPNQAAYHPAPRAQTSLDNYNTSSSRRLLKKSSLSSLKRLFSKKRHGGVDAITE